MYKVNTKYKIRTPTGFESFGGVVCKTVDKMYTITFEDDTIIRCSENHAFLSEGGFIRTKDLTVEHTLTGKKIKSITFEEGTFKVYDPVNVDKHNTYYSEDVISHNTDFLGSASTLISGPKIAQMMADIQDPIKTEDSLDVYEEPVPNNTYVISVDVSEGQEKDYSTFSVVDVSQIPYKMVAKYRNNQIKPLLYPAIICSTAKKYNEAFVLVEINSIGGQVADILHNEFAYENLIKIRPSKGKVGQQVTPGYSKQMQFGLKQSAQTKKIGCANLKTLIESDKLIVKDIDTVSEFTTFSVSKSSYSAEDGKNDDLVMTLVNFGWLAAQRYFKESIQSDIRKVLQEEQFHIMDMDLVPFGAITGHAGDPDDDLLERDKDGDLWRAERTKVYPFDDMNWDWRQKL